MQWLSNKMFWRTIVFKWQLSKNCLRFEDRMRVICFEQFIHFNALSVFFDYKWHILTKKKFSCFFSKYLKNFGSFEVHFVYVWEIFPFSAFFDPIFTLKWPQMTFNANITRIFEFRIKFRFEWAVYRQYKMTISLISCSSPYTDHLVTSNDPQWPWMHKWYIYTNAE